MSQGKSSRNRTQKPVSPRQKQLSVSSETSDEEYLQKWIQCDKCECWDIIENAGSSMKTDTENGKSNDVDNEDFICRVCKLTIRLEDAIIEIKIARDENKTLQNKVSEMEKKLQDRDKEIATSRKTFAEIVTASNDTKNENAKLHEEVNKLTEKTNQLCSEQNHINSTAGP